MSTPELDAADEAGAPVDRAPIKPDQAAKTRKQVAGLVLILGLAAVLAAWTVRVTGVRVARNDASCAALDVQRLPLRLELAADSESVRSLLGDPGSCARAAARAMVRSDYVLAVAYAAFVVAMFGLLAQVRAFPGVGRLAWFTIGALIALVAGGADLVETALQLRVISGSLAPDPALLARARTASLLKWYALAVSCLPAGWLWWRRRVVVGDDGTVLGGEAPRWRWVSRGVGAVGVVAAGFLAAGMRGSDQLANVERGLALLLVFWGAAVLEAVVVAREALPIPLLDQKTAPESRPAAAQAGEPTMSQRAYPDALREQERQMTAERRRHAGLEETAPAVGFGLSGGGIRSATVNLGVFQGLAATSDGASGPLGRIDVISTVSGGGYFGSFLGRLWSREFVGGLAGVKRVLRGEGEEGRNVMRYLRENGRYLSPNGAGDLLLAGAVMLRNWVAVQIVLAAFLVTVCLGLQALRPWLDRLASRLDVANLFAPGALWWSPWLLLPLVTFTVAVFPLGWAYWLVEPASLTGADERRPKLFRRAGPPRDRSDIPPWMGLVLVLLVAAVLGLGPWRAAIRAASGLVASTAVLTLVWKWLATRVARRRGRPSSPPEDASRSSATSGVPPVLEIQLDQRIQADATERQKLSLWLSRGIIVTATLLALALVDSLGQTLYRTLLSPGNPLGGWLAGVFSGLGALAAGARRIAVFFGRGDGDRRPSVPVNLIASLAALLLVTLLLVSFDAASHAVAWHFYRPLEVPRDVALPFIAFFAGFVLSVLLGQTLPFVNRSSHHALYSSRLIRAYLGASNDRRWRQSVTRVLRGDDTDLMRYWPPPSFKAAPIHLLNVTVNETVSGRSQIEQKDRKGNNLALGPYGFSFGVEHHAVIALGSKDPLGRAVDVYPRKEDAFRVFEYPQRGGQRVFTGESLTLGEWVGVSGAAFSTGLGARTSLGLSLLAGFGNVRLGRWWDSGVEVRSRHKAVPATSLVAAEHALARVFPAQVFLFDEFLARFHGPSRRHWYLSDGGHFENLGGYELIRRRLPLIVLIDAEQDSGFQFGGLSNLIRKARIDFGAEIEFLRRGDLNEILDPTLRGQIGELEDLRPSSGFSGAHAAMARVTFGDDPGNPCRLLYVKATLTGDESADILEYHRAHADFPHESTADQFFDEAQWESYRKLGEHIGERLFARPVAHAEETTTGYWWPWELRP